MKDLINWANSITHPDKKKEAIEYVKGIIENKEDIDKRFDKLKYDIINIIRNEKIDNQEVLKIRLEQIIKAEEDGYDIIIHENKLLITLLQEVIIKLTQSSDNINYYKLEINKTNNESFSEFK